MSMYKFLVYLALMLSYDFGPLHANEQQSSLFNVTLNKTQLLSPRQPQNLPAVALNSSGWHQRRRRNEDEFHFLVTGGYRPKQNDLIKFVVSIRVGKERRFFGDNHICGGAIISKNTVLTAAHCLFLGSIRLRANKIHVVAGTPRRLVKTQHTQVVPVQKAKPHPKYSSNRLMNDVGLLKLKEEIKVDGNFVDVIPITRTPTLAGQRCTVCGWGTVIQFGPTPDEAVNADLTINSDSYCDRLEGFTKGMICASDALDYEVDSCQGDSGGPLICDAKVCGIVSFGYGCGEPDSAGVYTDVYHFRDWIEKNAAMHLHFKLNRLNPLAQLLLLLLAIHAAL